MKKRITDDYKKGLMERLKDTRYAEGYLREALKLSVEDKDGSGFQLALKDVAEARGGMTILAHETGFKRENLYRVLSKERQPKFDSILKVASALGYDFGTHAKATR
jgi:probable addiction module antidote protein